MPKPQLEWRQQAMDNLVAVVKYIAEDNPDAAQELEDEVEEKAARFPDHRSSTSLRLA